jgi:ATP-dependent Clp protease ATP-binding subunit ClpC
MNMNEQPELSVGGRRVMMHAKKLAKDYNHDFITTEHVLLSIMESDRIPKGVKIMQTAHRIDIDEFRGFVTTNLSKYRGPKEPSLNDIEPSSRMLKMLSYASCIAQEMESTLVDVDHLLLSILVSDTGSGNNLFKLKNIDVDILYEDIYSRVCPKKVAGKQKTKHKTKVGGGTGDNDIGDHTESVIETYANNLTRQASRGELDPVIGREEDVQSMIEVLSRRTKNNPVLIGEPGVGKTAVVELLALKISKQIVPTNLRDKQIYTLDLAQLVAGTIYRGQFEERLKEIINYVQSNKDIILFIDELHMLVGAGSTSGSMDASNILKPALARGKLSCIGATTLQEYKEHIENDGALDRRFQSIVVDEPAVTDTIEILRGIKSKYEEYHNVRYNKGVLAEIVNLCDRYMTDKRFPDKAIDVMDEIGSRVKIERYNTVHIESLMVQMEQTINYKNKCVENQEFDTALGYRDTEYELSDRLEEHIKEQQLIENKKARPLRIELDQVRRLISDRSGVPVTALEQDEAETLKKLSCAMKTCVIGQDDGIDRICNAVKRNRAGVSDPNKPICSLLFLGPTGVGKTHLARSLGEQMFHDGNFKQFDMSEFSEKHSVSKLIGSPPGYIGYGEGGDLTEFVRYNPYCVLLFDEVEKAHPEVLQLFLQVLEYGQLTDSEGLDVNFKNTIVIMTSNIGAHRFEKLNGVGFSPSNHDTHDGVIQELQKMYSPEFLNRIDETVIFNKLDKHHVIKVTKLLFKQLKDNLRRNIKCRLMFDDQVINHIVELNDDTMYGARPLRRLITEHVETPLADVIIDHPGDVRAVRVSINQEDRLTFDVTRSN